jgi:hypothetical protein
LKKLEVRRNIIDEVTLEEIVLASFGKVLDPAFARRALSSSVGKLITQPTCRN